MEVLFSVMVKYSRAKDQGKQLGYPTANNRLTQPIPKASMFSTVLLEGKTYNLSLLSASQGLLIVQIAILSHIILISLKRFMIKNK